MDREEIEDAKNIGEVAERYQRMEERARRRVPDRRKSEKGTKELSSSKKN